MNNFITTLDHFSHNQKLCAVYFKSPNGLSNLKFYYLICHNNQWVLTGQTLQDEKFFKDIYYQSNIGKNTFLQWIHNNITKDKYIHISGNIDIIITKPLY